jgi:hypothetical protein
MSTDIQALQRAPSLINQNRNKTKKQEEKTYYWYHQRLQDITKDRRNRRIYFEQRRVSERCSA